MISMFFGEAGKRTDRDRRWTLGPVLATNARRSRRSTEDHGALELGVAGARRAAAVAEAREVEVALEPILRDAGLAIARHAVEPIGARVVGAAHDVDQGSWARHVLALTARHERQEARAHDLEPVAVAAAHRGAVAERLGALDRSAQRDHLHR